MTDHVSTVDSLDTSEKLSGYKKLKQQKRQNTLFSRMDRQLGYIKLQRDGLPDLIALAHKSSLAFHLLMFMAQHSKPNTNVFVKDSIEHMMYILNCSRNSAFKARKILLDNKFIMEGSHSYFGECYLINVFILAKGVETDDARNNAAFVTMANLEDRKKFYEGAHTNPTFVKKELKPKC